MEALSGWQLAGLVMLSACLLSFGQQNGDVRLVGGNTRNEGRVEIFYDNTWGAVCSDVFNQNDKGCTVVCRQLGYSGKATLADFGPGTGDILLDRVSCQGGEKRLMDCKHRPLGEPHYTRPDDAACSCDFEVRLVGGGSFNEGRVEVFHNNSWGDVCDFLPDENPYACPAVCNQLGYTGTHVSKEFGSSSTGKIWLDNVLCEEGDRRLAQCRHLPWGEHNCRPHHIVAGCSCHVDLRLFGAGSPYRGRVEVRYENSWQALLWDDYEPDDIAACKLVCYHLGHSGGNALTTQNRDGDSAGHSKVACLGHGGKLQGCQGQPQHTKGCSCEPAVEGDVRLVGGKSVLEGRVEVVYNNTWGTVCSDYFPVNGCTVACHELGYSGISFSKSFGRGTGNIWLDDARCRGNESHLVDCKHLPWGENNCSHLEDAGCVCGLTLPVRLVGGSDTHEGRVEVSYDKAWGTICDDGVSSDSACSVTCRELGFGGAAFRKQYEPGTAEMLIDKLDCLGKESRLAECVIRFSSAAKVCNHGRDLGCACGVQATVSNKSREIAVIAAGCVMMVLGLVFCSIACCKRKGRPKGRSDGADNRRYTTESLAFEMQAGPTLPKVSTSEYTRLQQQSTKERKDDWQLAKTVTPLATTDTGMYEDVSEKTPATEAAAASETCKQVGRIEPKPDSTAVEENDYLRPRGPGESLGGPDEEGIYCSIENE